MCVCLPAHARTRTENCFKLAIASLEGLDGMECLVWLNNSHGKFSHLR